MRYKESMGLMTITTKERELLALLLDRASDEFANHGCNDFDLEEFGMTRDEVNDLVYRYYAMQGTPDDFDGEHNNATHLGDWQLMLYFKRLLLKGIK